MPDPDRKNRMMFLISMKKLFVKIEKKLQCIFRLKTLVFPVLDPYCLILYLEVRFHLFRLPNEVSIVGQRCTDIFVTQ